MSALRALAVAALLLSSCVDPGGGAPSRTFTFGPSPPSPSVTPTATQAPTPSPSPTPSPRIGPAVVRDVKLLVGGLDIPWSVDLAPDGRLFITERTGSVRIARLEGDSATLLPEPWVEVNARASTNTERGLLGLALDPDFAANRYVYLYYSYAAAGNRTANRLVRMRDDGGTGVEETILLDGIAGSDNHDGGRLRFGPDGKLYVTTGDGEVQSRAQDTTSLSGKILRLNRDGSVPTDDPYPNGVWSFGHRNVQGIAFHPDTGLPYATEHGPSGLFPACCNDEVNLIQRGANYGWPIVTGQPRDPRFVDPLVTSGRADTWAPSGAAFLTRAGPLRGSFLFATLRGQHLHRVVFAADGRTIAFEERLLENQYGRLRDVFELPSGKLLVLTSNRDGRGRAGRDDDRILLVTLG